MSRPEAKNVELFRDILMQHLDEIPLLATMSPREIQSRARAAAELFTHDELNNPDAFDKAMDILLKELQ